MYKLSSQFQAHSSDVRCIFVDAPQSILTASRDLTSKNFTQTDFPFFQETISTCQHPKYVSAVCMVPPTEHFPLGLILTGCNDSKIRIFLPGESSNLDVLDGHSAEISSLFYHSDLLISGSLDSTAIVWRDFKLIFRLVGHSLPVWSVSIHRGRFLTASADKTIRLWGEDRVLRVFKGHTDCVRGIAVNDVFDTFLSCSNDGTVKCWNMDSSAAIETFSGHSSYVYCVKYLRSNDSMIPGDHLSFVSSGEDRSLRVWRNGKCIQTIFMPVQSVWCTECLPNGDVLAGSSDGIVRVFTTENSRFAGKEAEREFELAVSESLIPAQISNVKTEDPSRLSRPGVEGQHVVVRSGGGAEAYTWSGGEWQKVGNVVGVEQKHVFEGREFDFVFDVELEDESGRLKLPYNRGESFEFAARRFIERNGLPHFYQAQIVEFLGKNVGEGEAPSFEPLKSFELHSSLQLQGMTNKLRELSGSLPAECQLSVSDFEELCQLNVRFPTFLGKMAGWPVECVFPLLDILRFSLATYSFDAISLILDRFGGEEEFAGILRIWFLEVGKNRIPIMKMIANGAAVDVARFYFVKVFLKLKDVFAPENMGSAQIARVFVKMMANLVLACRESVDAVEEAENVVVQVLMSFLREKVEEESVIGALRCVGTLLVDNTRLCGLCVSSLSLQELLMGICGGDASLAVVNCSRAVTKVLEDTLA